MINKNISALILMLSFNNFVNCMNPANGIHKPIINFEHSQLRNLLKNFTPAVPTATITNRVNKGTYFLSNLQGATEKDKNNFRKYIIAIQARAIAAHPGHNFNFSPLP